MYLHADMYTMLSGIVYLTVLKGVSGALATDDLGAANDSNGSAKRSRLQSGAHSSGSCALSTDMDVLKAMLKVRVIQ